MKKARSLADLAEIAGVTAATVSRALKDSPEIGQKTKERIRELAKKHNYTLNTSARNLRLQRTNTIAVVVNAPNRITGEFSEQPYMAKMLGQLSDDLAHQGLDMMVSSQRNIKNCWDEHFLQSKRADGLIIMGQGDDPAALSRLSKLDTPFVVFGAYARQRSYCVIGCDSKKAGQMATDHLITDARRRQIIYLGPAGRNYEGNARIKGYQSALADHGLPIEKGRVVPCELSVDSAYDALKRVVEEGLSIDGIFACNDEIAIGAIQYFKDVGISVPDEVSIVGFDDIQAAKYCAPSLTTIRQLSGETSKLLVDAIQKRVAGEKVRSQEIPAELVVRESSVKTQ